MYINPNDSGVLEPLVGSGEKFAQLVFWISPAHNVSKALRYANDIMRVLLLPKAILWEIAESDCTFLRDNLRV